MSEARITQNYDFKYFFNKKSEIIDCSFINNDFIESYIYRTYIFECEFKVLNLIDTAIREVEFTNCSFVSYNFESIPKNRKMRIRK